MAKNNFYWAGGERNPILTERTWIFILHWRKQQKCTQCTHKAYESIVVHLRPLAWVCDHVQMPFVGICTFFGFCIIHTPWWLFKPRYSIQYSIQYSTVSLCLINRATHTLKIFKEIWECPRLFFYFVASKIKKLLISSGRNFIGFQFSL